MYKNQILEPYKFIKMKSKYLYYLKCNFIIVCCTLLFSCNKEGSNGSNQNLNFPTVTIGKQVWMAKNLDVSTFRDGTPILESKSAADWYNASTNSLPRWCYYNFDSIENGQKYGRLYNQAAINNIRGLAPQGWHIPIDSEWLTLINFVGNKNYTRFYNNDDTVVAPKLRSTSDWMRSNVYNIFQQGTNETKFNALPGGKCYGYSANSLSFSGQFSYAYFWKLAGNSSSAIYLRCCYENRQYPNIIGEDGGSFSGFYVRCVKD